jgi:hypothetical protein
MILRKTKERPWSKLQECFRDQIETNFPTKKDGRLVAKRKKEKQDKTARKRPEYDTLEKCIYGTKTIGF